METLACPFCRAIHGCACSRVDPNDNHKQVMPQTIEAYKELAQRDLDLIMEMRTELGRLRAENNKLRQKLTKRSKSNA